MLRRHFFRWAFLLFASTAVHSQVVREDSVLVDGPDGKTVVLNVKTGVEAKVVKRQGFWVQIEVGGKTGWLKAASLSFSGGASGPTAIDTGRTGKANIVSTSSARGLSAKDLLNGSPNVEEVLWLESRSVSLPALETFLANGGIVALAGGVKLVLSQPVTAPTAGGEARGDAKGALIKKGHDDW